MHRSLLVGAARRTVPSTGPSTESTAEEEDNAPREAVVDSPPVKEGGGWLGRVEGGEGPEGCLRREDEQQEDDEKGGCGVIDTLNMANLATTSISTEHGIGSINRHELCTWCHLLT